MSETDVYIEIKYTGVDVKAMAEEAGVDLEEAESRAANWGGQIQDMLSEMARNMLNTAIAENTV